jgi:predicted nucleic acid-binding protein
MVRKLIDANGVLRYLLRDDDALFKKASALLDRVKSGEEAVVIPESVLAECVYPVVALNLALRFIKPLAIKG